MTETTHTPEQGRFIIATLQNAHDLVVEAEILLRAQKWARAYALATFAIEEAGKAWRAQEQFYFDPKAKVARLHHSRKLAAANEMATLFYQVNERAQVDLEELYSEENEILAGEDFNARMAGLYVDFVDGEVVGGPGTMAEDRAHVTVAGAGEVVHIAMHMMWQKFGGPVTKLEDFGGDDPETHAR